MSNAGFGPFANRTSESERKLRSNAWFETGRHHYSPGSRSVSSVAPWPIFTSQLDAWKSLNCENSIESVLNPPRLQRCALGGTSSWACSPGYNPVALCTFGLARQALAIGYLLFAICYRSLRRSRVRRVGTLDLENSIESVLSPRLQPSTPGKTESLGLAAQTIIRQRFAPLG